MQKTLKARAPAGLFVHDGHTLLATPSNRLPSCGTAQFNLGFAPANVTRVAGAPGTCNDWVAVDSPVFVPVPEPGTSGLMALGLALCLALCRALVGLAARRRRSG